MLDAATCLAGVNQRPASAISIRTPPAIAAIRRPLGIGRRSAAPLGFGVFAGGRRKPRLAAASSIIAGVTLFTRICAACISARSHSRLMMRGTPLVYL
jgi:hypothetical protein